MSATLVRYRRSTAETHGRSIVAGLLQAIGVDPGRDVENPQPVGGLVPMARSRLPRTLRSMSSNPKGVVMRKLFEYGGIAASVILIAFGAGSIGLGAWGFTEVRDNLARENIVGTPDSTIPGQKVDTGSEARAFADVMRKHTLESTEGRTYAEMGRYLTASGEETNDESAAAKDPKTGQPVANGARNLWVTETALATALNMAYMGERLAVFGIVMGIALLLTGIGFLVLVLGGVLRAAPEASRSSTRTATVTS
jgi:hypothetical protein